MFKTWQGMVADLEEKMNKTMPSTCKTQPPMSLYECVVSVSVFCAYFCINIIYIILINQKTDRRTEGRKKEKGENLYFGVT